MRLLLVLAATSLLALPSYAEACARGTQVGHGETAAQIAARCGVNVEALKQLNPGLGILPARAGTHVAVPPRALPSAYAGYGNPRVTVQPPAAGAAAINVRVPRPATLPAPANQFGHPLVGHMPSILEPPPN